MKSNKSNSDLHSYLMAYVFCEQFLVCLVFVNLTSCMEWAQSVEIHRQTSETKEGSWDTAFALVLYLTPRILI